MFYKKVWITFIKQYKNTLTNQLFYQRRAQLQPGQTASKGRSFYRPRALLPTNANTNFRPRAREMISLWYFFTLSYLFRNHVTNLEPRMSPTPGEMKPCDSSLNLHYKKEYLRVMGDWNMPKAVAYFWIRNGRGCIPGDEHAHYQDFVFIITGIFLYILWKLVLNPSKIVRRMRSPVVWNFDLNCTKLLNHVQGFYI